VLHETVRRGNTALAENDLDSLRLALTEVIEMLNVLGLSQGAIATENTHQIIDGLVQALLTEREAARARKDFATADALRDKLIAAGLTIEDTATGVRWSITR
jgi:cysteinyl-tRNA synthetase